LWHKGAKVWERGTFEKPSPLAGIREVTEKKRAQKLNWGVAVLGAGRARSERRRGWSDPTNDETFHERVFR